MVGSIGPRMLAITLPHVQAWNVWYTQYGNTPAGLERVVADVRRRCVEAGRGPDDVHGTAAVYVQAPGGGGRTMGQDATEVSPLAGEPRQVAEQLAAFAATGITHLQVVLDPITVAGIEWLGEVLAALDG